MSSTSLVQNQMYKEVDEKIIFEKASQFAKEYLESVFERNVYPTEQALADLDKFDESMPLDPTNANDVIKFLNEYGSPATVTTTGARYFGFVSGGAVPVSLAAKVISTFWDQAPAMHVLSPIGSALETVVEKWLKEIFNLPESTVAGFVSGTSTANICGLAAARFRLLSNLNWNINDKGLFNAPQLRIVTGKHAHSTILKAIGLLGFGKENIE